MTLSRRAKMFMAAAGLAGAGTVAAAGTALADAGPGPGPVQTRLQIVDYEVAQGDPQNRDCPAKGGGSAATEGTQ